jgi:hypothetical protein
MKITLKLSYVTTCSTSHIVMSIISPMRMSDFKYMSFKICKKCDKSSIYLWRKNFIGFKISTKQAFYATKILVILKETSVQNNVISFSLCCFAAMLLNE